SRLQDKVHAIVTKDGKREVKVVASGLHRPNGIALHKGTLYIAELSQISKIDNIEDNLDNPPKPTVILSDLPKDEPHGWRYLAVGADEKLYFQIGAPCNICLPPVQHGKILEPFMTGFIQNNNYVGRPVDVLPMTDGSLLVSDDFNGAVYRVTRTGRASAAQK